MTGYVVNLYGETGNLYPGASAPTTNPESRASSSSKKGTTRWLKHMPRRFSMSVDSPLSEIKSSEIEEEEGNNLSEYPEENVPESESTHNKKAKPKWLKRTARKFSTAVVSTPRRMKNCDDKISYPLESSTSEEEEQKTQATYPGEIEIIEQQADSSSSPAKGTSIWLKNTTNVFSTYAPSHKKKSAKSEEIEMLKYRLQQVMEDYTKMAEENETLKNEAEQLKQENKFLISQLEKQSTQLSCVQEDTNRMQKEEEEQHRRERQKKMMSHALVPSSLRLHMENLRVQSEMKEGALKELAAKKPFQLTVPVPRQRDHSKSGGDIECVNSSITDGDKSITKIPFKDDTDYNKIRCDDVKQRGVECIESLRAHIKAREKASAYIVAKKSYPLAVVEPMHKERKNGGMYDGRQSNTMTLLGAFTNNGKMHCDKVKGEEKNTVLIDADCEENERLLMELATRKPKPLTIPEPWPRSYNW